MPRLNMTCVICEEDFKRSNVVHSTYCGRIFHKSCLDNWKLIRKSCPMCQRELPSGTFDHQLFLELNDQEENTSQDNYDIELVKTQIQSANEKHIQLRDQIKELIINCRRLKEQLTDNAQAKNELEQKIRQQKYTEDDFLDLQYECTNSTETIRNLKQTIQQISMDTEAKTRQLDLKCKEILQLKTNDSLSDNDTASSESALKRHIRILEQRLKHLSGELDKEIANSTCLSIENMRLESYIKTTEQHNRFPLLPHSHVKKHENIAAESQNLGLKNSCSDIDNSLIIDNLPINHIRYPLENIIFDLAAQMHLATISLDDIYKVRMLDKSNWCQPQTRKDRVSLFVEFNANEMKHKFLANKNILKNNPLTSSYILRANVEDTHSLYLYAKEKLKTIGFTQIFCKDNQVYAKQHSRSKIIQVLNKMHVDDLLKCHIQETAYYLRLLKNRN